MMMMNLTNLFSWCRPQSVVLASSQPHHTLLCCNLIVIIVIILISFILMTYVMMIMLTVLGTDGPTKTYEFFVGPSVRECLIMYFSIWPPILLT